MNLKAALEKNLQTLLPGATLSVSDKADFQCNAVFAAAKAQHLNPATLATELSGQWNQKFGDLATVTPAGGFLNFVLSPTALSTQAAEIIKTHRLPLPEQAPRTIFFDYGGANIAKELHIGHLRSPIIGEALKRVFRAFGHRTISGAYLGDWGLQMGLVLAELADRKIPLAQVTLATLDEVYPAASARKKTDPAFYERAAKLTADLQNYTEPTYQQWQKLRELSVAQIKKNYDRLNCTFDQYDGESTYRPNVPTVLDKLAAAGVLAQSQGATIVNVAQPTDTKPMPPIVLQKQNGGYLYALSDLSALYTRAQTYHPDQIIYVVDARQSLHFEQIFRAARLGGLVPAATQLTHVPYGTINGTDGKPFKTRDGGTIKLEDILTLVTDATDELAIGVSALKFADLINNVRKDYVFDLQKCVSFEGKTGPYLLYTDVRLKSILRKAGKFTPDFSRLGQYLTPELRDLYVKVVKLTEAYSLAQAALSVHPVAEAVYHLANSFSVFYAAHNILHEPDAERKQLYLSTALLTQTALELALDTLAIDTVEKM